MSTSTSTLCGAITPFIIDRDDAAQWPCTLPYNHPRSVMHRAANGMQWSLGEPTGSTDVPGDPVHHPAHYTGFSNGAEVIDITENLTFNRGNAVKYLARAGAKDPARELEDLQKAAWYVQREIDRLTRGAES